MKKSITPTALPDPATPAKKAVRKSPAKKVVSKAQDASANLSEPIAAKKTARKTSAKKAPEILSADVVASPAAPVASVPAPTKKIAAKKTGTKSEAFQQPELPIAISPAADPAPPAEIKPRAPRKTAPKKVLVPNVETVAVSSQQETPAMGATPVDYHPDQNRFGDESETLPPVPFSDHPSNADGGPAPSYRDQPGYRPSPYPPRQQRPYPSGDLKDGLPPPSQPAYGSPDHRPGPPAPNGELGPDGLPRRLTKWERWKQRKEKFKQQKQQRYLERTGRPPQPGPNGEPGAPEGEVAERREFREPRPDARPEYRQDPRPDPRGEPRAWEPRPPRPEVPPGPPEDCCGLLEMTDKGFAFLRPKDRGFVPSPTDPFVSAELVRQHGLREGVWVDAVMQRGGRGPQVTELKKVNSLEPSAYRTLPLFEELTAINPNKRYILETDAKRHTTRLIDFISPIGRGQRGLIVAPPRAGKTTFLQHIAEAVLHNYGDVKVIVLLVDERPEEVTEIARALPGAEIMASSNDQDPRNHIRMAHLAIERAKRLVEAGQHVFMLLDSITRLARGFNNSMRGGSGGKAMSGGLDSRALEIPRRLFAAARNTREAGSLTIMATALVETNNKGDDLIFQEFKGTGNMELVLDRKISQAYIYPAVDIFKSGTRREELLLPAHQLEKVHLIRRGLSGHRPQEAVERLLQIMGKYTNNNQMLIEIKARGE